MNDLYRQWIETEMGGLYGSELIREMDQTIGFYALYDGQGQDWAVNTQSGFRPTKLITNFTRKLINDESRFMASRAPEINLQTDKEQEKEAEALKSYIDKCLTHSRWRKALVSATRDAFIGRRVAMRISAAPGKMPRVTFSPSLEFVYDVEDDGSTLSKIIFFYEVTGETVTDKTKMRIWRQKYRMEGGRCLLDEGLFDGYGRVIREDSRDFDTGLDFIPAYVIINGGLTGDMAGESDVETIRDNQHAYNHLKSDDIDSMKYNMFPQKVFMDASEESMKRVQIAPNAMIDLQSDPAAEGRGAAVSVLETGFTYGEHLKEALERYRDDMHELLSVPRLSADVLKGIGTSGKAMRAMYWSLICRCEEKWAEGWDDAITWMCNSLIKIGRAYGEALPEIEFGIKIEHLYPLIDDEEEERERDLTEVAQLARSRKSYIEKWQTGEDADGEIAQIMNEKALTHDDYAAAVSEELSADTGI